MTKAELVRKLAKRVFVPEEETKIFWETFLHKLASMLKPGDSVKCNDTGYFHYLRGKSKNDANMDLDLSGTDFIELFIFSNSEKFELKSPDNLIFNISLSNDTEYNRVDDFFSLSVGKPVVPLQGEKDVDFMFPLSSPEMKRLIESKVEKLVSDFEIIRDNNKDFRTIFFKHDIEWDDQYVLFRDEDLKEDDQMESTAESESRQPLKASLAKSRRLKVETDSDNEITSTENENLTWDFGRRLSRELEEESILDFDKVQDEKRNQLNIQHHSMSWDFDQEEINLNDELEISGQDESNEIEIKDDENESPLISIEDVIEQYKEENKSEPDTAIISETEDKDSEFVDQKTEDEESKEEKPELIENNVVVSEISTAETEETGGYLRVKSPKSEIDDQLVINNLLRNVNWQLDNRALKKFEGMETIKDGFVHVLSKTRKLGYDLDELKDFIPQTGRAEKNETKKPEENKMVNEKSDESKPLGDYQDEESDKDIKEAFDFVNKKRSIDDFVNERRKKSVKIAIILFVILILLIVLVSEFTSSKKSDLNSGVNTNKSSFNQVVQRVYNLPVEYPYKKNDPALESDFDGINPSLTDHKKADLKSNNEIKTGKTEVKLETKSNKISSSKINENKVPVTNSEKPVQKISSSSGTKGELVGNNIFKYGNYFTVQVSSWPTRERAEGIAENYTRKGYHAFIEEAQIPGKGTWYRVKIGDFKTLQEAKNFSMSF
jgi:cell division septation protein DedD